MNYCSKNQAIKCNFQSIDLAITDARSNLLDSLRFAASERAHGVTIVFDGKVIAGTRGKKERSKSYNAFSSINFPYLAVIQDEHILYYIDDKWQDRESVRFYHEMDSQVSLLKLIPSMDSSLLDYMAEHYEDAITIELLARQVHLSESYFMQRFREISGMGAIEYLNRLRIQKACEKILGGAAVADAAYQCGFKNLSNFNRKFKVITGCTPRQYKKQKRG